MSKVAYNYEESQKLLIKSIIAQPNSIPAVSEIINSEDFSNIKYKEIYKASLDLYSLSEAITGASLFKYLKYNRNIDLLAEDLELFSNPPVDAPVTLAEILKSRSIVNKAIELSNLSAEELATGNTPLETLGKLQKEASELSFELSNDNKKTLKDEVKDLAEYVLQDQGEEMYFIPSPYESLNKYINGGFRPEQLITVGARTGVGKTVVATQATARACSEGKSVLYFSLEMSSAELIKRLTACHGNIMLSLLEPRPDRDLSTKQRIEDVMKEIAGWKLKIIDDTDVTIEKIRSSAQQMAQSESGLDMVIIDYLQLISSKGMRGNSRQEIVAEISRNCKMMAKELNVPVMVLVQLNREQRGDDEDRLPSKADIRESAAIAADSDIILILHRKNRDDSPDPKATFILDKNRGGPSDRKFNLRCVLEKNIFQDLREDSPATNPSSRKDTVDEDNNLFTENQEPATDFGNTSDIVNWMSQSGVIEDDDVTDDYDDLFMGL